MNQPSNNKRIAKNTLMLYIRMLLSMVVSLYTSRVVLEVLGVEDYGIYGVVGGVVAMFSFLNSSMAGATSRFLTFEMGRGDEQRLKDTFSSALIIHIGIALVVFILAETVGLWFLNNKLVIPEGRMYAAHWVYQLSIVSTLLMITQVPYNASIIAHEKMDIYAYVEILNVSLKLIIVFLLKLVDSDKLIVYAILMLSVSFIVMMVYRICCIRNFCESRFHFVWKREYLKPMLTFSGWDIYGNMAFTIRQQGANFLLNMFYGVAFNAACGIASTVQGIFLQLSSNVVTAFKPAIIKEYAGGRYEKMNLLLCVATKMAMLLLMITTIVVFVRMDFILQLWLGQIPEGAVVLSRMMLIMNFFSLLGSIIMIGVHATGKVVRTGAISGTLYILTIPVMYVMLVMGMGYFACYVMFIISTMLFCVTNLLILKIQMPQFVLKDFVVATIVPATLVVIIAFVVISWISTFICEGFWGFVILGLISVLVISLISFIIMLNNQERVLLYNLIKSKLSR